MAAVYIPVGIRPPCVAEEPAGQTTATMQIRPAVPAAGGATLSRYRRTGADPPFGDPARYHGVAMEGYYWRFTDPVRRRVVVALIGVNRDGRGGTWATVALAAHPGGHVRSAVVAEAWADPRALGAGARDGARTVFAADARGVRVDLGDDARLDARIGEPRAWPRRALGGIGPAQIVPGLS